MVTGATGFIGRALCSLLVSSGYHVRRAVRTAADSPQDGIPQIDTVTVGDIGPETEWDQALLGIDVVVHLAARVHFMKEPEADPAAVYHHVNTAAAEQLARSAVKQGVKRFVFLSTAKVNGEETGVKPFTEQDQPAPQDPYAHSKFNAETLLKNLVAETGMEVVVIRPPLVYGPGVKGNFKTMLSLVAKGIPLPFGAVNNKRSLVSVDNLVDLIATCIKHPAAANQIFMVADGEDLSTAELLQRIGQAMNKSARLIAVPAGLLQSVAAVLGKDAMAQRVLGSLQVDISKAKNVLDWKPPCSVDAGLQRCIDHFCANRTNQNNILIRSLDILFSLFGLLITFPLLVFLSVVGFFDTGSPIFLQQRVGRWQQPFVLIKFRTMKLETASVATHLASSSSITRFGHFLRRTKLDELPQLWNVLVGDMSLVGPRPCLFNQEELIRERAARDVFAARPGITGLAQVNEIDMSTPKLLAETDRKMLSSLSVLEYFRYIFQTVAGKGSGDRVRK
nr:hybrid nucleoside-diphosphate sugar epimerase/sugar transferase [Malonomonas rubra]